MSIGKVPPPLGQGIHVRRHRLGVATHEAHPVVEVIDGNEQYVGARRSVLRMSRRRESHGQESGNEQEG